MNKRIGFLFVTCAAFLAGCAGPYIRNEAAATPYKVYFLGGQSNMDGYGYVNELTAEQRGPIDGAMIFTGNMANDNESGGGVGVWEPLLAGHGTGFSSDGESNSHSDRFGPELVFGATLVALQPESRVAIIKYSRGGSGLALDIGYGSWEPDFAAGDGVNQYDHALTTISNALAVRDIDGDGVDDQLVPAGIVWMQGETDAGAGREYAEAYEANLKRMMDLLRAALHADDLPVVIGKITDSGMEEDGAMMDYIDIVVAAQQSFVAADGCAAYVTAIDGVAHLPDQWHYVSEGYVTMGRAFAEAALDLGENCRR